MSGPWFPSNEDYKKVYIKDSTGTIWLVVHDGGMVTTADYSGKVWSGGIQWLEHTHGPLEYI